ncbi:MAG TPA: hypothetical protein VFB62_27595 [Polyangiaceae bacterium]|jgi:hypothetical protein|nr:hypothetical protein [Polyangiaceae bacterium]
MGLALIALAACDGTAVADDDGTTSCLGYADEEAYASLTVRIRNDSALDIYLPAQCAWLDYRFVPTEPSDAIYRNRSGGCLQTCAELQEEPQRACAADDCATTALLVPSGGSADLVWDGTGLLTGLDMPAGCYRDPNDASTPCSRIVAAKPGEYRLDITGYTQCGESGCTCEPDGTCWGQATGQSATPDPMAFQFPASAPVEVVFNQCAFGCAD